MRSIHDSRGETFWRFAYRESAISASFGRKASRGFHGCSSYPFHVEREGVACSPCSGVGSFDVSGLDLWHPEGAETDEGADLDANVVPVDCGGPLELLDFGLRTRVRRRVEVSPRTARRF